MSKEQGTHYVLTNKDGQLDGYFFHDGGYIEEKKSFYSTADIKPGERLYLVNNYYEEKTFIVQYRIYSLKDDTFYLEVKEYKHEESYSDPDFCYTDEFVSYVKKLAEDKYILEYAEKKCKENYDPRPTTKETREEYLAFSISWQIMERMNKESRTYLDTTPLLYRIEEIVYPMRGLEYKRPNRWDYSEF